MIRMYTSSTPKDFIIPPTKIKPRTYPADKSSYIVSAPDTGKKVYVYPSILTDEELATLSSGTRAIMMKNKRLKMMFKEPEMASTLRDIVLPHLPPGFSFTEVITISYCNDPIPIHIDTQDPCPFDYKVLIYLNQAPENTGGTIFYTEDEKEFFTTPNHAGSVIVFDAMLKHASQPFPKEFMKLTLGIRATN